MEGWNPSLGCALHCQSSHRGWVPSPLNYFPRRDALMEAAARTHNPCMMLRSSMPSFPPSARPCNLAEYEVERQESQEREAAECCEKYEKWRTSLTPYVHVTNNCNRPICVNTNPDQADRYVLVDIPVRSNVLTGVFNPDDNKTNEEYLRQNCDRFWVPCGGSGLRPYPCRGVIDYPLQRLVDTHQSNTVTNASICAGTKYVDPDFIQQQYEECQRREEEKRLEDMAKCEKIQDKWFEQNGDCYPPHCPTRPCCP